MAINQDQNNRQINPMTNLVRTVRGTTRNVLYYDPDLFDELIIISASLLVENEEDKPYENHWNSVFDEDLGTSGTSFQTLEEIAIPIYPVPKRTKILGQKRVKPQTIAPFNIPDDYDINGNFTYEWELIGNATFVSTGTNITNGDKNVSINFLDRGTVTIKVKILNDAGCFRYIIRNIFVGEVTRKMLVVRYPYF